MSILIVLVALGAGAWLAIRWLPPLASGGLGPIVFWLVCGLVATATATFAFGLNTAVRLVDEENGADGAASVALSGLRDAGILLGIAAGVYLLSGPRATGDGARY
ncbi:MAG: hypothetical protein ACXW08_06410 [Solirubrobacteraceae bacterium]